MSLFVKNVYSTADSFANAMDENKKESTDVIVTLSNDEKYLATFFTFDFIKESKINLKESQEYLNGKCFYYNNMILVDELSLSNIQKVVNHLFDEGVLSENFKKIGAINS